MFPDHFHFTQTFCICSAYIILAQNVKHGASCKLGNDRQRSNAQSKSGKNEIVELLAGAFFVEYIFGWKGIGKVTVDALEKLDFPVVMGSVLISATFFIIINILADILYGVVDPRVRVQ